MEPKQAIRFDHVDYKIDDTKILKDINHGFNQGEITTLVGPSGAGKTTLIRLCNGLFHRLKDEFTFMISQLMNTTPSISGKKSVWSCKA